MNPKINILIKNVGKEEFTYSVPLVELFFLPAYWYKRVVPDLWLVLERFKQVKDSLINIFLFAPKLAVCSFDRSIVDQTLSLSLDVSSLSITRQCIIYVDIGTVLYDLSYRQEGEFYLEKTIELYFHCDMPLSFDFVLLGCFRFNRKERWVKRKEYVSRLANYFPQNLYIKQLQVKSLIDLNELVEAETLLKELMAIHRDWGEFLLADLYFKQADYDAAGKTYSKFIFPEDYHFWRAQYDYKEAVALFKTNQAEKWRKKATAIGCRLAWDKFYQIDSLENEGVERISEIDEVINASRYDKRLFCSEQVFLFVKKTSKGDI